MKRRKFLTSTLSAGAVLPVAGMITACKPAKPAVKRMQNQPYSITMWDFSWLERRWTGAGYEDWDMVLDELVERGYDAVRMDAYPHFMAEDPGKVWTLPPHWSQQTWGSPALNKVRVHPEMNEFIAKCRERNIRVGLSSWFRKDTDDVRMKITSPEKMAEIWIKTIRSIESAGLLDAILYVDLCNEWPGDAWAPYFVNDPPEVTWGNWHSGVSMEWMKKSVELVRKEFPGIPLGYSFDWMDGEKVLERDLSFLDYGEPHIWMAQCNGGEFYNEIGYKYDLFKSESYENLVLNGKVTYEARKQYWQDELKKLVNSTAEIARKKNLPLMTTECWSLVDYKDWPLLEWDWIKELCEVGVREAASSGMWAAIATSNFCGPQFVGMWRDVEWHQRMNEIIKGSDISGLMDFLLMK